MNIVALKQWIPQFHSPLVVAGPCAAETEEQVLSTARSLCEIKSVRIFRAGLWKPRSRPGPFQGVGEKGLTWLQKVQSKTGLLVATEVATPKHVEAALKAGIDVLWVGARTTGNPFSVQDIADALCGHDIPVIVKNPPHADLGLWIGAFERLEKSGLSKLAAVHRGIAHAPLVQSSLRNSPAWNLPLELKRLLPQLPLLCDPSHIAGQRENVEALCKEALRLGMEGLMIEAHTDPDSALSDADQQVTCAQLKQIIEGLQNSFESNPQNQLEELRHHIDNFDREIIESLGKRFQIVKKLGNIKEKAQMNILQEERAKQVLSSLTIEGEKQGLSPRFIQKLYRLIHEEAVQQQSRP